MSNEKLILEKLDAIKEELDDIKGRLVNADTVLTEDDVESLRAAEEDLEKGKTVKL